MSSSSSSGRRSKRKKESSTIEKKQTERDDVEITKNGREEEGGGGGGRGVGLKEFVKAMEGKSHRMVEMRLGVVASCGVAFKVLLYDQVEEDQDDVIWSALSLVAVAVLVIVMSTWLEYFPRRLSQLHLRPADGQGLALGCLLAPTVLCSIIHCSIYTAPHNLRLLSVYLMVLCVLSLLSLSSTILHSIPFPNNVVLYNFLAIALTFVSYQWFNVPYWLMIPCVVIYSGLVPWFLSTFPVSFTLCEAMMISQGLSLLFTDTALQIISMNDLMDLPEMFNVQRHQSLLYVEFLLFGVLLCCLLLSPAFYKLVQARNYIDHKFWSGSFILLSLAIGFVMVLPWLQSQLHGHHPIAVVLMETFTRPVHLVMMVLWLMVTVFAVVLVTAQTSQIPSLTPLRFPQPGSVWMRKTFHLLAVVVFLPSLALSSNYLSLSSSITFFLFTVLELYRYFKMWPGGVGLHSSLKSLTDNRDSGALVLSHIYLLLGLSLPLWLSPLTDHHHNVGKLSLYSGVLSVGVGDSIAALAGSLMGRTHWPGVKKTVEGSAMSVLTQLVVVLLIVIIDPYVAMPTPREWGVVTGSVVATAIMEAYTGQIDNIIISLFQLAFFLTFL